MGCVALHIGFQLIDSACCESLSHASGVPAPFNKGAFFAQYRYGSNDETPESMGFPGDFLISEGSFRPKQGLISQSKPGFSFFRG